LPKHELLSNYFHARRVYTATWLFIQLIN